MRKILRFDRRLGQFKCVSGRHSVGAYWLKIIFLYYYGPLIPHLRFKVEACCDAIVGAKMGFQANPLMTARGFPSRTLQS